MNSYKMTSERLIKLLTTQNDYTVVKSVYFLLFQLK